ncbi:hypothetical protein Ade02nite_33240 [Paractinoplanes deccanensis]|uniref:Uncharacterized protein n=1 Tax=Paractinoplanes deccanensis TaxID=113561 RepID=A0ABQ3Y3V6_9ACTN|nr:hypothetical protein Ade02nite_33240 [Actinoplanes deccanensis]
MTIYQHPLAYLLGLEGVALLRAFAGEHGREFTHARFAEPGAGRAGPSGARLRPVTGDAREGAP